MPTKALDQIDPRSISSEASVLEISAKSDSLRLTALFSPLAARAYRGFWKRSTLQTELPLHLQGMEGIR